MIWQTEKAELLQEIEALERTLDSLKRKVRPHECELVDRQLRHQALRRALQPSALMAAEAQALFCEFVVSVSRWISPLKAG